MQFSHTPLILVVDDHDSLRTLLCEALRDHGMNVVTASNGLEAFELARQLPFDAVLADLHMPQLDGWGLIRLLRNDTRTREIPIALVSGDRAVDQIFQEQTVGADAYLPKGSSFEGILKGLELLLAPRREVLALLNEGAEFTVPERVGSRWLMFEFEKRRFSGVLSATDDWATYEVFFSQGLIHQVKAQAGRLPLSPERAFAAFVASPEPVISVLPGDFPVPFQPHKSTRSLLETAQQLLLAEDAALAESMVVNAISVEVDRQRLEIYRATASKTRRSVAESICSGSFNPRSALKVHGAAPVKATLKDLVRHEVIRLCAVEQSLSLAG